MDTFYEIVSWRTRRSIFGEGAEVAVDVGDRVLVEVEGRRDIGEVIWKGGGDRPEGKDQEWGWVVRKATAEDIDAFALRRQKEDAALRVFKQKIDEHGLPMKPIDVEYEDDVSRITFYFTAENRVDFRALVRDLAHIYHTRIELRQISPRQEVQRSGGYGTCGRPLCCACFMRKLHTVPAHAARDQSLSQNLSKMAGVCGQLKCCLRYELDFYREAKSRFPEIGSHIHCSGESCRVEKTDIFQDVIQIRHQDGALENLPMDAVEKARQEGQT